MALPSRTQQVGWFVVLATLAIWALYRLLARA
jgi:hypothetical protein